MLRKPYFAATAVSLFLVVYCVISQFPSAGKYVLYMFLVSPVLVVWMVITVLKYGSYKGKALDDREFGYQDKDEKDLGTL